MADAVVRDYRLALSFTNVAVPRLDVLLTMGNFESRIHVEGSLRDRVEIDSPEGTPVVYDGLILPPKAGEQRSRRFRSGRRAQWHGAVASPRRPHGRTANMPSPLAAAPCGSRRYRE